MDEAQQRSGEVEGGEDRHGRRHERDADAPIERLAHDGGGPILWVRLLTEHEAANFRHGAAYGVARSDELVYIRIIVFDTRTAAQKKALFQRIAELLHAHLGLRPEDVFVNIVESAKENWSVGHGLQQFA